MSFRFFRRIKLLPGVTLNLSRSGPSLSVGPRGAKVTAGPRGTRTTVGLPGTGLHYTQHVSNKRPAAKRQQSPSRQTPARPEAAVPDLQTAQRRSRGAERDFLRALELLLADQPSEALTLLRPIAAQHPDFAWVAGMCCIQLGDFASAIPFLHEARRQVARLGETFTRHGIALQVSLPVTPFIRAHMTPCLRGLLLAEAECHQALGLPDQAAQCLEALYAQNPSDPVVRLSLTELILEQADTGSGALNRVLQMTNGITNDTFLETGMLGLRAQALRRLGNLTAAREVLTAALRRTKDRPPELLQSLRYDRALVYEALGQMANARKDLERLYAEDTGYADVAVRLGVKAPSPD